MSKLSDATHLFRNTASARLNQTPVKIDPFRLQTRNNYKRKIQLRLLMMMGIIRNYKKQYIFRKEQDDLDFLDIDTQELTFVNMESLQTALLRQLQKYKGVVPKGSAVPRHLQERVMTDIVSRKNLRQKTLALSKSPRAQKNTWRHRQEIKFFKRLNCVIDNVNSSILGAKVVQHFRLLIQIIENLKKLVYESSSSLKKNQHSPNIMHIRQYCQSTPQIFAIIHKLITNIIVKNKKFLGEIKAGTENRCQTESRHVKQLKLAQKTWARQKGITKDVQILIFNMVEMIQLKIGLQNCQYLQYIAQNQGQSLKKLINQIISLRYILGYITNEIINFTLNAPKPKQSNSLWQNIYTKKYMKNPSKSKLKL